MTASVAASGAHADFSAAGVGQDPAAAGGAITRRGGSRSRRGVDHLKAAAEERQRSSWSLLLQMLGLTVAPPWLKSMFEDLDKSSGPDDESH